MVCQRDKFIQASVKQCGLVLCESLNCRSCRVSFKSRLHHSLSLQRYPNTTATIELINFRDTTRYVLAAKGEAQSVFTLQCPTHPLSKPINRTCSAQFTLPMNGGGPLSLPERSVGLLCSKIFHLLNCNVPPISGCRE